MFVFPMFEGGTGMRLQGNAGDYAGDGLRYLFCLGSTSDPTAVCGVDMNPPLKGTAPPRNINVLICFALQRNGRFSGCRHKLFQSTTARHFSLPACIASSLARYGVQMHSPPPTTQPSPSLRHASNTPEKAAASTPAAAAAAADRDGDGDGDDDSDPEAPSVQPKRSRSPPVAELTLPPPLRCDDEISREFEVSCMFCDVEGWYFSVMLCVAVFVVMPGRR